jgi:MoaA/NifB/PqqE/SkfB family radical SAM enzyme
MIEGKEVEDCAPCYQTEEDGGKSLRQLVNSGAQYFFEASNDTQIIEKASAIVRDHDGNAPYPSALNLWLGNHCNLKCRMCNPAFSSQIASDVVHSKWWGEPAKSETVSCLIENPDWSRNEKIIFDEIFEHVECLKQIQFFGGEPLLHPMVTKVLEKLVETGHAAHITVYISTNGTVYSKRLSTLLRNFLSVLVGFSLDGVGKLQEYIRTPSKWSLVSQNILDFQKDKVPISIQSTVQTYNIFGLLDLARWCGQNEILFQLNVLYAPDFLSLDLLPQNIINEALKEWLEYSENECTEDNRESVETVIAALRRPRPDSRSLEILQDKFIRFTNDLDHSRHQSFAATCPKFYDSLLKAGFDFHLKYQFCPSWLQIQATTRSLKEENSYLKHQLSQTQAELSQATAEIEAMKSSKFWKTRVFWFSIKRRLRFPIN